MELYNQRLKKFCKRLFSEALEEEEGGIKTTSTPTMGMSNGTISAAPTKAYIATKKRKVNGIEANTSDGGQYMCVTCKKTFDSHWALGGH